MLCREVSRHLWVAVVALSQNLLLIPPCQPHAAAGNRLGTTLVLGHGERLLPAWVPIAQHASLASGLSQRNKEQTFYIYIQALFTATPANDLKVMQALSSTCMKV